MFGGEGRKRPILQSSPIRPASDFDLGGGWGGHLAQGPSLTPAVHGSREPALCPPTLPTALTTWEDPCSDQPREVSSRG